MIVQFTPKVKKALAKLESAVHQKERAHIEYNAAVERVADALANQFNPYYDRLACGVRDRATD